MCSHICMKACRHSFAKINSSALIVYFTEKQRFFSKKKKKKHRGICAFSWTNNFLVWSIFIDIRILPVMQAVINSFMTEVPRYRNQSIDLLSKSVDWFLYDRDLRHERVKWKNSEVSGDWYRYFLVTGN